MQDSPPPRALIVEDEPMVAMFVEEVLQEIGIGAEIAGTLAAAKTAVATGTFDFALFDLNLNGELTYPAVDLARARDLPAVIVSGYGADTLPAEYAGLPVLAKPFQVDALIKMARQLLAAKGRSLPDGGA